MNFETKPRDDKKLSNFETRDFLVKPKDKSKSASNLAARDWNISKTESPKVLKLKKIKLKKQRANKISSLNTMNSKKQRIENKKREAIKKISNIERKKSTITNLGNVIRTREIVILFNVLAKCRFKPLSHT